MRYFTAAGPERGPLLYRDAPDTIGVLEALRESKPIGRALSSGWDPDRVAVWQLTVHGEDVPGRWIVVDRQFRLLTPPEFVMG
jgi:hypothetical protein